MSRSRKARRYGTRAVLGIVVLISFYFIVRLLFSAIPRVDESYELKVLETDAHIEVNGHFGKQHVYSVYLCNTHNMVFMSIESESLYAYLSDHIGDTVCVNIVGNKLLGRYITADVTVTADWLEEPVPVPFSKLCTN